jgi:hypothetical protein
VAHLRDRPGLPAWHCHGASVTSAGGPGREYHVRSASTFTAGAGGPCRVLCLSVLLVAGNTIVNVALPAVSRRP